MKRLLLLLILAFALPKAVSAETYWLIIIANRDQNHNVIEKVPMNSLAECEVAGKKLHGDRTIHGSSAKSGSYIFRNMRVVCIKGK